MNVKLVAGWLEEASVVLEDYVRFLLVVGAPSISAELDEMIKDFASRPAQVEAMTCASCKSWAPDWSHLTFGKDTYRTCRKPNTPTYGVSVPSTYGCVNWEAKP